MFLVSCGGSTSSGVANSVTSTPVWTTEESNTIQYYTNLLGVKYNVTDKYDYSESYYDTTVEIYIGKKNTTFTTTLYSQTFLIIKTGDGKYELTTNGTTTSYTSLQTVFNVVNQFS